MQSSRREYAELLSQRSTRVKGSRLCLHLGRMVHVLDGSGVCEQEEAAL